MSGILQTSLSLAPVLGTRPADRSIPVPATSLARWLPQAGAAGAARGAETSPRQSVAAATPGQATAMAYAAADPTQDRAITPQDPDIAIAHRAPRLSTTPDTLPTGVEKATMRHITAAIPSPSARGGAFAWLTRWWRKPTGQDAEAASPTWHPRLSPQGSPLGFREFTAPRRMQQGGGPSLRARAFGQRARLDGGAARRSGRT